ncbi:MAG: phosphoribosylanthranilate isomerase [Gammaproteobacteria bacterium]|nr:phosphoribosylanthranilate isomerase [Gammaproteobacteria bacterium]
MVNRTRVKICGITRPEDGLCAARLGADAIGLVFYADSPRAVSIEQAQTVVAALPPFVTVVALFVNPEPAEVDAVIQQVAIDLLQFHGDEPADFCQRFAKPYIKAVRMRDNVELMGVAEQYATASALLLDSYKPGVHGGTGHHFDWSRFPSDLNKPIILAGGLQPENVADAISRTHPFAVDVSSGVEVAKGVKDNEKMNQFMRGVSVADAK